MDDYYKAGHERLREVVSLHHNAIGIMLRFIKEKEETEMETWNPKKNTGRGGKKWKANTIRMKRE